jgi:hypothetical protein
MNKIMILATCLVAMAGFSQVVVDSIKPIKLDEVELRFNR